MADHRPSGWYGFSFVPMALGGTLFLDRYNDYVSGDPSHSFWSTPTYVALGLLALGLLLFVSTQVDWLPRNSLVRERRKALKSTTPVTHRAGRMGSVGGGISVQLPDGRFKQIQHSPLPPKAQSGELPIRIRTEGASAARTETLTGAESWTWTYEDITFTNESDEHVSALPMVVAETSSKVSLREISPTPNSPIILGPHETKQGSLTFELDLTFFDEDERLNPGRIMELHFLEVGVLRRRLLVTY